MRTLILTIALCFSLAAGAADMTVTGYRSRLASNPQRAQGYIEGMAVGMKVANASLFCAPDNIHLTADTLGKIIASEIKVLEKQKGQIDLSRITLGVMLQRALQDAYPCH